MWNIFKKSKSKELQLPKRMWLNEELSDNEIRKYKHSSNQIAGALFIDILNEKFTPYIKSLGFKGSKNNFYKHAPPWIHTVNIFKNFKYGGECTLNAGVHLDFIEDRVFDKLPVPNKFTVADCIIDMNIPLDNDNGWYVYGATKEEGYETVDMMISMFEKKAIPFLKKYEDFPKPFSDISFADLMNPSDKFIEFEIPKRLLDWVHFRIFLAKVYKHIGDDGLAARILEKTKNDCDRPALIEPIEKLLNNYHQQAGK